MGLLTRDKFRESVFERDEYKCVKCGQPAKDAHHIIERRLFPDGGYYLDNGASLCEKHHIEAETTELSAQEIRELCGIQTVVLPPHFYSDLEYDKWGNIITSYGRLRGELFYDESVQKIIKPVINEFVEYVKYPRTYHVPWSQPGRSDDRYLDGMDNFIGRNVVITEKMDGENTTMYNGYIHARSINSGAHPARHWVKGLWGRISWEIPKGWRICGENLYAQHTIEYDDLDSYFQVFSIWNENNICLNWNETVEYCELLELNIVPVLYEGIYTPEVEERLRNGDIIGREGWVIRLADEFSYSDFRHSVAKYVNHDFVVPHGHWMRSKLVENKVK